METSKSSKLGIALIILAGCFWGSMGIFVRKLGTFGFSAIQIVSIRITLAALESAMACTAFLEKLPCENILRTPLRLILLFLPLQVPGL